MTDYLRVQRQEDKIESSVIYQKVMQAQNNGRSETSYIGPDGKRVDIRLRGAVWWEDQSWLEEMY